MAAVRPLEQYAEEIAAEDIDVFLRFIEEFQKFKLEEISIENLLIAFKLTNEVSKKYRTAFGAVVFALYMPAGRDESFDSDVCLQVYDSLITTHGPGNSYNMTEFQQFVGHLKRRGNPPNQDPIELEKCDLDIRYAALDVILKRIDRKEVNVPGDGNCQFHAIAHQMQLLNNSNEAEKKYKESHATYNHQNVRKKICDYMQSNAAEFDLFRIFFEGSENTDSIKSVLKKKYEHLLTNFNSDTEFYEFLNGLDLQIKFKVYVNWMRQPGTWGDEFTLVAAANAYEVKLFVIGQVPRSNQCTLTCLNPKNVQTPAICVIHDGSSHYKSTVRK